MVSGRENIRSAHVETLKAEMLRTREGRKGERSKSAQRPGGFDVP